MAEGGGEGESGGGGGGGGGGAIKRGIYWSHQKVNLVVIKDHKNTTCM